MKTTIISIAFIFTASLLMAKAQKVSPPVDQSNVAMTEESYVDDIPFDTWAISRASHPEDLMAQLPEEGYVDDIPFDTRKIACKTLFDCMLKEYGEASVDDIPFNTEKIAQKAIFRQCLSEYMDEANVNDIPFNTRYLACCQQMMTRLMPAYVEEDAARDICFNTEELACKYLFGKMVEDYRTEEAVKDMPADVLASCTYDRKRDVLILQVGAEREIPGFRSMNNINFRMDMEQYMKQFSERIRDLDHLTMEPF